MPKYVCDFSEAVVFERTVVPPGYYNACIDTSYARELKVGQGKGTPYITLGFVLTSSEYAGKTILQNYMLAGKGSGRTKDLLKAFGMLDSNDDSIVSLDTDLLEGMPCKIRVRIEKDQNGEDINSVVQVRPLDSAA